ncbi:MAG: metallophosphoesterase [Bacteroidia bacterium]|nr:metallophosphoesterase [Bacteroidia bacterium]
MKNILSILLLYLPFSLLAQNSQTHGWVFEDKNRNGIRDTGEAGIAGVSISDQHKVVQTNAQGFFRIESSLDFPYLFISMPEGYSGKFYYPKASEQNFPLTKTEKQDHFFFIHASDTHIDSANLPRMLHFRKMAEELNPAFIIITGDLVRDALRVDEKIASAYYEMYVEEIEKFSMPVFSGVGNHEIFGIERDKSLVSQKHPLYGKGMYRHYLGPNYYSFNYGGLHFISIDGVDYQNLYYFGGVDSVQLDWLENDLSFVEESKGVITFNHIPFVSPGFSFQNFDSHLFYGPVLLKQKGKLEHRHIVYNYEEVKKRIGDRPFPFALSGHYHAVQEGNIFTYPTTFAQTSAISGPDSFPFQGHVVKSGFTLYEVKEGKIIRSEFIPLNLP